MMCVCEKEELYILVWNKNMGGWKTKLEQRERYAGGIRGN